ncbi:MAG: hypothetical protein U1F50_08120 [Rubrivivax sp.]
MASTRILPVAALALLPLAAGAADTVVYKCPGPPVLYTDQLSAQEARDKGCTTIEGAPVTVIQAPRPRPTPAPAASTGGRTVGEKVDPADQRARDSDARRILADELRREEERLSQMQKDFNNGEPERRGDERNYARYQERVADMKAAIQRKQDDIAAIRREIAKLPQAPGASNPQ